MTLTIIITKHTFCFWSAEHAVWGKLSDEYLNGLSGSI